MNKSFFLLIFILASTFSGCTVRYSQSLVGSIPNEKGMEVSSNSSGFAIVGIVLSEPSSAEEQVIRLIKKNNCKTLNRVEIDYRELSFLLFSIPKVKVTGTCVE